MVVAKAHTSAKDSQGSNLKYLYRPRGIAVVGASSDPRKWGSILYRNIRDWGFGGQLYPVNRRGGLVEGANVYTSQTEVGTSIDVSVVALRADLLPEALDDAMNAGVKVMVVPTSGFAEMGLEGRELQRDLVGRARENGVRIVGPNCMGYFSSWGKVYSSLALEPGEEPGGVALLSQSGNVGVAVFRLGQRLGVRFHSYVSVGNQADLAVADYVSYLADDADCNVVLVYLEGVTDGSRLIEAVRTCTARKPVVILKGGRETAGQKAAASHTGSLAADKRLFDDLITQAGALVVDSYESMITIAQTLSSVNARQLKSVAILTDGGGFGVLGADAVSAVGIQLSDLSEESRRSLRSLLPDYCSLANPVDVGGDTDSDPSIIAPVTEVLLKDAGVDGVLITSILGIYGSAYHSTLEELEVKVGKRLPDLVERYKKPVIVQSVAAREAVEVMWTLRKAGLPVLESVQQAAVALGAVNDYWVRRERSRVGLSSPSEPAVEVGVPPVTEPDWYRLLGEEGLPVPQYELASSEKEIIGAAKRLNWPVVLKAVVQGLHKSDRGGVATGIVDEAQLKEAYRKVGDVGNQWMVANHVEGNVEVILSYYMDPLFGPVVVCGLGGRLTEHLGSVGFGALPMAEGDAFRLISQVPVLKRMGSDNIRGFDAHELVELVERFGSLVQRLPGLIQLELNPVILGPQGACIVDAKGVWDQRL